MALSLYFLSLCSTFHISFGSAPNHELCLALQVCLCLVKHWHHLIGGGHPPLTCAGGYIWCQQCPQVWLQVEQLVLVYVVGKTAQSTADNIHRKQHDQNRRLTQLLSHCHSTVCAFVESSLWIYLHKPPGVLSQIQHTSCNLHSSQITLDPTDIVSHPQYHRIVLDPRHPCVGIVARAQRIVVQSTVRQLCMKCIHMGGYTEARQTCISF